mgnify:CR=1 FL=1
MHMTNNTPPSKAQRGISLIESLIAIVVMALGILGILGVQMRTLTDTQAGVRRAQAIRLIEDLAERLQNNPDSLNNLAAFATTPSSGGDCTSTACTPAALATYDIFNWKEQVSSALPGGTAKVFVPLGGPRQLGVLIGWRETRYNQSGGAFSTTDIAALEAPLVVAGKDSASADVKCDPGLICHLQYIQPTQRCTPWALGGGALYCPN